MSDVTPEQIAEWEESQRRQWEARYELVRKMINFVRQWRFCENRRCRRIRECCDPAACYIRYKEDIHWVLRNFVLPRLRKRYPGVQWGAPAGIVELQLEAALAAEAEEKARREGQPVSKTSRSGMKVERHPLYDPKDV